MNSIFDVIIVGGGLAGLTAAIHLSGQGRKILLIEKNSYPKHKVCGEYVSNEIMPYLEFLGINFSALNLPKISKTTISTVSGKQAHAILPMGGFGISRYTLDHLLYNKAVENGITALTETVNGIAFGKDHFTVTTGENSYQSQMVLGAFGKRSNIDQSLRRKFIFKKSPWLAVKAHYSGKFPNDLVGLHYFNGGYCGVSKVENDIINICYLVDYKTFKKYKDIEGFREHVVCGNLHLKKIFEDSKMIFKPITISQISFGRKKPVENHILMMGDTAGLIHPLCGNGMAMAIHSAKIASNLLLEFFDGRIHSREDLEKRYRVAWNTQFKRRIQTGKLLAFVLRHETISNALMNSLTWFPALLPWIIRQTHGNTVIVK